jgi:hypothetical protein
MAVQDKEILEFLALAGSTARYITSVCTRSVILGMAGLLEGYRAATHWAFYEPLEVLGIEASHERVAVDRNRITGGGVTAGVDFGLTVIAEIKGRDAAEFTQLGRVHAQPALAPHLGSSPCGTFGFGAVEPAHSTIGGRASGTSSSISGTSVTKRRCSSGEPDLRHFDVLQVGMRA